MAKRTLTPERAEALRVATAQATPEFLRRAGATVPAQIIVDGLMAVVGEIVARDVKPRNRAATLERCRAALDMAERRS